MTTQVIFKIEKKLKEQAMKKSQNQGIPFSSVLKFATQAYVKGQFSIGMIGTEEFNPRTKKEVAIAIKDFKSGRNISPVFNSAKEAIKYLKT